MKYRSEIDGLRTLAVLPVILFHAAIPGFSGGYVGVDIFFVISGFLVSKIIYEEIVIGNFSIVAFYERRARRILPALFFVSILCIPFAWMWMLPGELKSFSQTLIAVNLFSSNILFAWQANDYFASGAEFNPLLHTWSLAVEEQFYIFFPLVLLLLRHTGKRVILATIALLSLLSLVLAQVASSWQPTYNFYLLPSRAWEFGIGALLAIGGGALPLRTPRLANVLSGLGLALILYPVFTFTAETPFPSVWTLLPVVGTALVIGCAGPSTLVGRILSLRPMVWIGLLSYSAYLWHQPLFAFARVRLSGEVPEWLFGVLVIASFALAYFSWRVVETPFRYNRKFFTRKVIFSFSIATSAAFIAFGVIGTVSGGLLLRFSDPVVAAGIGKSLQGNPGLDPVCTGNWPVPDKRYRGAKPPTAVLWGDSFAMHLVQGLESANPGLSFVQMTRPTCGPFVGLGPIKTGRPMEWTEKCVTFNDHVRAYIEANPQIRTVILASAFSQYIALGEDQEAKKGLYKGAVVPIDGAFMQARILETMDWLASRGITPILIAPPPMDGRNSGMCAARARLMSFPIAECEKKLDDVLVYLSPVLSFIDKVKDKYTVYYPSDYACADGSCAILSGPDAIYIDRGHLTAAGSVYVLRGLHI